MTKEELVVKGPLVVIMGFLTYMTSLFSEVILALIVVMMLDYISGVLRGLLTKSLNSTIGLKGIVKKVAMILILGMAGLVQFVFLALGIDTYNMVIIMVACFFFVNEGISFLENCGQLGAPLPTILYESLEKLREIGGKEQRVSRAYSRATHTNRETGEETTSEVMMEERTTVRNEENDGEDEQQ